MLTTSGCKYLDLDLGIVQILYIYLFEVSDIRVMNLYPQTKLWIINAQSQSWYL